MHRLDYRYSLLPSASTKSNCFQKTNGYPGYSKAPPLFQGILGVDPFRSRTSIRPCLIRMPLRRDGHLQCIHIASFHPPHFRFSSLSFYPLRQGWHLVLRDFSRRRESKLLQFFFDLFGRNSSFLDG